MNKKKKTKKFHNFDEYQNFCFKNMLSSERPKGKSRYYAKGVDLARAACDEINNYIFG